MYFCFGCRRFVKELVCDELCYDSISLHMLKNKSLETQCTTHTVMIVGCIFMSLALCLNRNKKVQHVIFQSPRYFCEQAHFLDKQHVQLIFSFLGTSSSLYVLFSCHWACVKQHQKNARIALSMAYLFELWFPILL